MPLSLGDRMPCVCSFLLVLFWAFSLVKKSVVRSAYLPFLWSLAWHQSFRASTIVCSLVHGFAGAYWWWLSLVSHLLPKTKVATCVLDRDIPTVFLYPVPVFESTAQTLTRRPLPRIRQVLSYHAVVITIPTRQFDAFIVKLPYVLLSGSSRTTQTRLEQPLP